MTDRSVHLKRKHFPSAHHKQPLTAWRWPISLAFMLIIGATPALAQLKGAKLAGMKARSIGPASMSGRIGAIVGVASNSDLLYVGGASGGVWKSINGGITWQPVFDDQPVHSIGAIAVDPGNSDVVWVGTGEGNPRNTVSVGNGVYKSTDGGRTWAHLGLEKTERIARIRIDPHHPDTAYVAAMGKTWGENPERGVFKTSDGGQTWDKVLYVNEKTGAVDLVMDPTNPQKLIAAMWEYRRWPWFFKSGGPGSSIHLTVDGGKTWTERTHEDGLPKGNLGRTGLAISRSRPQVVYALVEAEKNALYRSDDGGYEWSLINDSDDVHPRPFYYADIRVDPQNENRIYTLQGQLMMSEDAGKSFRSVVPIATIHGDYQDLWIHPENPLFMISGNDGGLAITRDRGERWRFVQNLPLAQFYHVNVDMETPYNVYGGVQDSGCWRGPSQSWSLRGIFNYYWDRLNTGDGFEVLPDASDPRYGYAMSQGGNLVRYDLVTGERKSIRPAHAEDVHLRFNWNAAIAADPFEAKTVYYGSQFVHRSTDRGDSWEVISPDLTTNDPEKQMQLDSGGLTIDASNAENHTTILTIAPSPVERGVIWVGTDDGNVQLTRDGGQTWTNVIDNIQGVPRNTWIPHIEASTFESGEAFLVFDNHRRSDWAPYVYQTSDFGRTWRSLATDELWGYALVIEQDPVERNLLFLGTEFGLYVSIDGGAHWTKWTHGFPTASAKDMIVHPRDHDLVVATHGRAIYVLDDIRPLRALARSGADILDQRLHLFEVPDAIQYVVKETKGLRGPGHAEFQGENRPYGALITYVVNPPETEESEAKDEVVLEILNQDGEVIRTRKGPAEPGVNRTSWGLKRKAFRSPSADPPGPDAEEQAGPLVLPGTYTLRVRYGDQQDTKPVEVLPDPRQNITAADRRAKEEMILRVGRELDVAAKAVEHLRGAREAVERISKRIQGQEDPAAQDIRGREKTIKDSIEELIGRINAPEVQGNRPDPVLVSLRLGSVYRSIQSSWEAPTEAQRIYLRRSETKLRQVLTEINRFFEEDMRAYQEAVEATGLPLFEEFEPFSLPLT